MQAFNADHMLLATFSCRSSHALKAALQPGELGKTLRRGSGGGEQSQRAGLSCTAPPLLHTLQNNSSSPEAHRKHKQLARSQVVTAGGLQVRQAG